MRHTRPLSLAGPVLALLAGCGQEYDVLSQPPSVNPEDVTDCPFSGVEGTRFQRYDCNPVFTNTDEDWVEGGVGAIGFHVEEVLGHAFYQMWYSTGRRGGHYGLGYAISANGTDWTPLPDNPVFENPSGGWNTDGMGAVNVLWNDAEDRYILAYQGVNFSLNGNGLGILSSPDGRVWAEERDGDAFLNLSEPVDGVSYCWPLALTWEAEDGYRGYITGGTSALSNTCEIYGYGGADLDHIEPDSGGPVLKAGPDAYDQEGMASAAVVHLDGLWYMFYVGIRSWEPLPGYTNWIVATDTTLNLATSEDGVHWEKSADNPFKAVSLVSDPYVIGNVGAQVVGDRIHLWIDDYYEEVGASAVGYFLYEPYVDPW